MFGKAYKIKDNIEIYNKIESLVQSLDKKDLFSIMSESKLFANVKDNIYEVLDYMNIIIYNTKDLKKINCIKIVEETKRRLQASCNYDMTIDFCLMNMWEEVNEKYNWS